MQVASASALSGPSPALGIGGTKTVVAVIVFVVLAAAGGIYWYMQRDK